MASLPPFLTVAGLGLAGIVASIPFLPDLLRRVLSPETDRHRSISLLTALAVAQATVLVVGCAWCGAALRFDAAPWTQLRVMGGGLGAALGVGAAVGVLGAYCVSGRDEPLIAYLRSTPLSVRLLYGGLTEEVIIRWGLLSSVLWGVTRLTAPAGHSMGTRALVPTVARTTGHESLMLVTASICLTTAVFAVGHIPLLRKAIPTGWRRAAALIFGVSLLWGWLAMAFGLVSSMAAHVAFHASTEALARGEA